MSHRHVEEALEFPLYHCDMIYRAVTFCPVKNPNSFKLAVFKANESRNSFSYCGIRSVYETSPELELFQRALRFYRLNNIRFNQWVYTLKSVTTTI